MHCCILLFFFIYCTIIYVLACHLVLMFFFSVKYAWIILSLGVEGKLTYVITSFLCVIISCLLLSVVISDPSLFFTACLNSRAHKPFSLKPTWPSPWKSRHENHFIIVLTKSYWKKQNKTWLWMCIKGRMVWYNRSDRFKFIWSLCCDTTVILHRLTYVGVCGVSDKQNYLC